MTQEVLISVRFDVLESNERACNIFLKEKSQTPSILSSNVNRINRTLSGDLPSLFTSFLVAMLYFKIMSSRSPYGHQVLFIRVKKALFQ